jgi:hypothetical protein
MYDSCHAQRTGEVCDQPSYHIPTAETAGQSGTASNPNCASPYGDFYCAGNGTQFGYVWNTRKCGYDFGTLDENTYHCKSNPKIITVPAGQCNPAYQDCAAPGQIQTPEKAAANLNALNVAGGCQIGQAVYDAGILGKVCIPDVAGAFNKISGYIIPGIAVIAILYILSIFKGR